MDTTCTINHEVWLKKEQDRLRALGFGNMFTRCPECDDVIHTDDNMVIDLLDEIKNLLEDMPPADWVVVDSANEGTWVCNRCKDRVIVPKLMPLETFINMSTAFRMTHVMCKEKP